ncbi:hypothetical protein FOA52_004735 [Chlamydomonas sp. UWO 241]|nr:hypothetical protein FOA52_004735 [Chlamydomonas sp. UWO 241]
MQVLRADGVRGLYRGFAPAAIGSVPGNAAYFGGYELGRALVPAGSGTLGDMAVGGVAQLVAGVVFTPVDIVKERMQVVGVRGVAAHHSSPAAVVRSVLAERGPLGLLRGYWATNAVWIPWNMLFVAMYSQAKAASAAVLLTPDQARSANPEAQLSPWVLGACSAASAAAAGLLTHPADVVKTRLQVMPADAARSAWTVAARLYASEGAAAFTRGLGARLLMLAPGSALSWAIYEPVKAALA